MQSSFPVAASPPAADPAALATVPGAFPMLALPTTSPLAAQLLTQPLDPKPADAAGKKVKTTMCKFFPVGTCYKGEACAFAHTEDELGTPVANGNGAAPSPGNVVRAGDWMCDCGNHNFASRIYCNSCGKLREGKKPGDWMCSNCRTENDASREACQNCGSAKETSNLTGKMEAATTARGGPRYRSSPYGKGGDALSTDAAFGADQGAKKGGGWWDESFEWGRSDPLAAIASAVAMLGNLAGAAGPVGKGGAPTNFQQREGDWTCEECGNFNFESRVRCNRHRCGKMKPGFEEGDWLCRRKECRAKNSLADEVCNVCTMSKPAGF
mmetsp:Transcript_61772/g.144917  ORF Transcript_61772/g.144917 Transcript_61772/m.144917 type:complete len:325 (-) Transcript_61772:64-1038(-)